MDIEKLFNHSVLYHFLIIKYPTTNMTAGPIIAHGQRSDSQSKQGEK